MSAKRRIAANEPHIETISSGFASFNTDLKAPLKSCRVSFLPVQEGSGDPSPSNVRAISGWTGFEITRCGKNLSTAATGTEMVEKWTVPSGASSRRLNFYNMPIGQEFTLSASFTKAFEATSNRRLYLTGSQKSNTTSNSIFSGPSPNGPVNAVIHNWVDSDGTIYISHNNRGLTYLETDIEYAASLQNIQLEIGSEATSFEPYNGVTVSFDWSTEAGTIYGGYVDLVNGEVVEEWAIIQRESGASESTSWVQYKQNNGYKAYRTSVPAINGNHHATNVCSNIIAQFGSFNSSDMNKNIIQKQGTTGTGTAYIALDETVDVSTVQYCFELATPIHHTIDPTILKTLHGLNNIWSNANGTIDLSYWSH